MVEINWGWEKFCIKPATTEYLYYSFFSADNRDLMKSTFFFFSKQKICVLWCSSMQAKTTTALLENCRNNDLLLGRKLNKGKHINTALWAQRVIIFATWNSFKIHGKKSFLTVWYRCFRSYKNSYGWYVCFSDCYLCATIQIFLMAFLE